MNVSDFRPCLYKSVVSSSCVLLALFLIITPISYAQAQSVGSVDIAKTYLISGSTVVSGDIVSFNPETQQYSLSKRNSDKNLFGVVSLEPVFVLYKKDSNELPIVRTGEVRVNVITTNGPIVAGDYVTSSLVDGKGQRANNNDTYIIGVALESFPGVSAKNGTSTMQGSVTGGSVRVLLSIGTIKEAVATFSGKQTVNTGVTEATVLNIVQYILAAFIAVGSLYIAFRNFGPNIKDGIISVGRNPLAKSSIQSMVILNAVLIILISVGGLLVSFAILLLPI